MDHRRVCVGVVILGTLLFCVGCGGGGGDDGGGDGPEPVMVAIASPGNLDGYITDGDVFVTDGAAVRPGVGDTEARLGLRQLFCFPMTTLPDGVSITRAELRIDQVVVVGDPYLKLGDVVVDCVREAPTLTFDGGDLVRDLGVVSTGPGSGLRTLDVTEGVRATYALGATRCWLRARFHSSNPTFYDDVRDLAHFEDGEVSWGLGSRPELYVWFTR